MASNLMHIQLTGPVELRKEMLKTSLEVVKTLKQFEEIKQIREERMHYQKQLQKKIKALKQEATGFDILPKIRIKKKVIKKASKSNVKPNKEKDKLELDMMRIKAKINSL